MPIAGVVVRAGVPIPGAQIGVPQPTPKSVPSCSFHTRSTGWNRWPNADVGRPPGEGTRDCPAAGGAHQPGPVGPAACRAAAAATTRCRANRSATDRWSADGNRSQARTAREVAAAGRGRSSVAAAPSAGSGQPGRRSSPARERLRRTPTARRRPAHRSARMSSPPTRGRASPRGQRPGPRRTVPAAAASTASRCSPGRRRDVLARTGGSAESNAQTPAAPVTGQPAGSLAMRIGRRRLSRHQQPELARNGAGERRPMLMPKSLDHLENRPVRSAVWTALPADRSAGRAAVEGAAVGVGRVPHPEQADMQA